MTSPSKILIVALHEANDFARVYEYVVSDGTRVVTYHLSDSSQDIDEETCRHSFSLSPERQRLYGESFDALWRMAGDEECRLGIDRDSYMVAALAFIESGDFDGGYFGLGSDFDETLRPLCKDAPRIKSEDAFALLSHFIPKVLWTYGMNYAARSNDLSALAEKLLRAETKKAPELKKVSLGSYPQTRVTDPNLIEELDGWFGYDTSEWRGYGYSAKDYEGDYMFYRDVEWEGAEYRGVVIKEFRPDSHGENIARNDHSVQELCGWERNKIYWFRWEPIEWYLVEDGETMTLLSVKVLDAEAMAEDTYYGNFDYCCDSHLRIWLREFFVPQALTYEKVESAEIPDAEEYRRYLPQKALRKPVCTDYASVKGFLDRPSEKWIDPFVWTSTYMDMTNRMVSVMLDGTILDYMDENYGYTTYVFGGVQPIVKIRK